ncbi:hypothetical protein ACOMHN_065655 [Nucella lapillus]
MDVLTGTPEYHSNSKRPVKETLILAVAFLCEFTSFQALQNLQSSLNQEQGLGVASLACVYGTIFAFSIITPAIVYNLGVRATILTAWFGHFVYAACNFYPHWAVLIPGSLLLGAVSCPLWISLNTYLSSLARVVVEQDLEKSPKAVITVHAAFSRLNGLFTGVFSASQLTGNLISSMILFQSPYGDPVTSSSSSLAVTPSSLVTSSCGAEYCPQTGEGQHLASPKRHIVHIMLGVFLALDAVGIIITWCFVPNLEQPRYTGREVFRKLRSYWQALAQPKLWLLIPFFGSRGVIFSLHIGMFTEAYVSCALGVRMVGYVMSVWGASTMMSAGLLGYAARYTGRRFLVGFAFLVDVGILAVLLFWRPHAGSLPVFFSLSAVMGLVDGIWFVQCNALIVVLFPAIVDSALSVSGTWGSLAVSTSFVIAKFICPSGRIYIALGLMAAAAIGYVAVEAAHSRTLKTFDRQDDHHYMLVNANGNAAGESDDDERAGAQETELGEEEAITQRGEEGGDNSERRGRRR